MLGDINALFEKAREVKDEYGDPHFLVGRQDLADFFGITIQVIQGWQNKKLITPFYTGLRKSDRRRNLFDLNRLFDLDRRLRFVPPTFGNLLEDCMSDSGEVESLLLFLGELEKKRGKR